jgi:hypothetical protein
VPWAPIEIICSTVSLHSASVRKPLTELAAWHAPQTVLKAA